MFSEVTAPSAALLAYVSHNINIDDMTGYL